MVLSISYKWGYSGLKMFNNLPKATLLIRGKYSHPTIWIPKPCSFCHPPLHVVSTGRWRFLIPLPQKVCYEDLLSNLKLQHEPQEPCNKATESFMTQVCNDEPKGQQTHRSRKSWPTQELDIYSYSHTSFEYSFISIWMLIIKNFSLFKSKES